MAGLWLAAMGSAWAGTNGFVVPIFRGEIGAAFAGWERFMAGWGTNNAPDLPGSSASAWLLQTETNAFVTGSGNIYNVTAISRFAVGFESRFPAETAVFQARTLGAELDYEQVRLSFASGGTNVSLAGMRVELDRGTTLGVNVSTKWEWDLRGRGVTAFTIEFAAAGESLSFDSATLDVRPEAALSASLPADYDRWMYPFNATPGTRPSASVFGAFGVDSGVDTRDGQFLIGWTTTNAVPAGLGAENYLVRRARVTLTINRDRAWTYDGTFDPFTTHLSTNDSRYLADSDPGRPVELFGAGFRNGYSAAAFLEGGPFNTGEGVLTNRNAFAAGFGAAGGLIDVSNNVGKRDEDAFEVQPFAVGTTTSVPPGESVPAGTALIFDLELSNPLVLGYLQGALDEGLLRLTATSLTAATFQSGAPNFPQFFTRDNALAGPNDVPRLELEVAVAPAPLPVISIEPAIGGGVQVSWPTSIREVFLLEANDRVSGGEWLIVAEPASITNRQASLKFNASAASRYFRLRRNP